METDILKPDTGVLSIERPLHASSKGSSTSDRPESSGLATPEFTREPYAEPVSEGEEDEEMDLAPAKDEGKITGLTGPEVAAAVAFREKALKERAHDNVASSPPRGSQNGVRTRNAAHTSHDSDAEDDEDEEGHNVTERTPFLKTQRGRNAAPSDANLKSRALSIDPLAPSSAFDEKLRDRLSAERKEDEDDDDDELQREDGTGEGSGDGRLLERNWRAPPGKKIAVPVRIEPKVYFATERTFLVRPSSSCSVYSLLISPTTFIEMAQLCHHHRNYRHNPPQLCSARRHRRTHQRWSLHLCSPCRYCLLCHHLRHKDEEY